MTTGQQQPGHLVREPQSKTEPDRARSVRLLDALAGIERPGPEDLVDPPRLVRSDADLDWYGLRLWNPPQRRLLPRDRWGLLDAPPQPLEPFP